MALYLAIDAGGTHTRCLLADDTRVLARASTGTVKLMRASEQEATARLQSVLEEVARSASVLLSDVTRTCFGLAGISSPAVRAWAGKTISTLNHGELILCGDEEIALDAAFEGGPGILVIAGTGNNAIGRSASGSLFGAGGWGPVLGDEGSGYWIGLKAIRAAVRAEDRMDLGGGSTCLLREIERHFNVASLVELVALANQRADPQHPALDFASLAPVVARCAEQGDSLAAGILKRAGEELAELVAAVFHKMNAAAVPGSDFAFPTLPDLIDVAISGGVLSQIAPVRLSMIEHLALLLPCARVSNSVVDGLDGALWRARHA